MSMPRRFTTLLCFALVLVPAIVTAQDFNVDSLLVMSVGGPDGVAALAELRSISTYGDIVLNGQPGTFVQHFKPPANLYLRIKLGELSLEQAYDGSIAWQRGFNGQVTVMEGFERRELVKTVYFESASYLFDDRLSGGCRYLGDTTVMGERYHAVAFYPAYEDTIVTYYDIETGRRVLTVNQVDQFTINDRVVAHMDTLGMVLPRESRAVAENAPISIVTTVSRIELNEPLVGVTFSPPRQTAVDARFPADALSVKIPMTYRNGHLEVAGTINGVRRVVFVLDSGASMNLFHTGAMEGLRYETLGAIPAQGVGGFEDVSLVRTDSVSIGELVLIGQVGGILDLGWLPIAQEERHMFGGLLGYDFLSRFPVLIDYATETLTVFNPSGFSPPPGGIEVPFSLTMQVPTVEAEVMGVHGRFIVDLGNAMALKLHRPYYDRHGFDTLLSDVGRGRLLTGGVGGGGEAMTAITPVLRLGNVTMDSVWTVIPTDAGGGLSGSVELSGNIGNRLLEEYRVLFDYTGERLILYPGDEQ